MKRNQVATRQKRTRWCCRVVWHLLLSCRQRKKVVWKKAIKMLLWAERTPVWPSSLIKATMRIWAKIRGSPLNLSTQPKPPSVDVSAPWTELSLLLWAALIVTGIFWCKAKHSGYFRLPPMAWFIAIWIYSCGFCVEQNPSLQGLPYIQWRYHGPSGWEHIDHNAHQWCLEDRYTVLC